MTRFETSFQSSGPFDQPVNVAERITQVRQTIPDSVRLIAVTKTVPAALMREAYDAGVRDFGESRVQEAIAKQEQLQDLTDICWHLIGHLQSNKAIRALQHFTWVHSLDSLKLARRLDQAAQDLGVIPQVCLQVKLRPDPNKYGWSPEGLWHDLEALDQCRHIKIMGLMAIPPLGLSEQDTLAYFEQVRALADRIRAGNWNHIQMQELSMGMSEDYPLAVQAGATMIRPGRVLFGDRPAPNA